MPFDYEKIKDILACPQTRSALVKDGDALVCVDSEVRFRYPIVDGIPRLLAEEGAQLSMDDWSASMQRCGRDPVTGAEASVAAN